MPPHVLFMRDRLKVVGVHADRVLAKVVKFEAFRNRPFELFVHDAMSAQRAAFGPIPSANHPSLSVVGFTSQPYPAPGEFVDFPFGSTSDMRTVTGDILHWLAEYVAESTTCRFGKRRELPATTHAQAGRVWFDKLRATFLVGPTHIGAAFLASFIRPLSAVSHYTGVELRARKEAFASKAFQFI